MTARTRQPALPRALRDGLARYCPARSARFVWAEAGSANGAGAAMRDSVGNYDLARVTFDLEPALREWPYHGRRGRAACPASDSPRRPATEGAGLHRGRRRPRDRQARVDRTAGAADRRRWIRLRIGVLPAAGSQRGDHEGDRLSDGPLAVRVRLRQPAAAEFGCSQRLLTHYLEQGFWDLDDATAGIDLWLTTAALAGDFRACEADLGALGRASAATRLDLGTTLAQVVGALFADLERRADVWQRVRGSTAVPVVAGPTREQPAFAPLGAEEFLESFLLGYRELRDIWTWVLPPRTIVELRKLTQAGPAASRFDDHLWASIIYDFAVGFVLRVMPRDQLLRSLTPLYAGWLASFIVEMGQSSPARGRRQDRAALPRVRIDEAASDLALALARAASLMECGATYARTRRSCHVGTS